MGAPDDAGGDGGVQCDGSIDTAANAAVVALLRKQLAAGEQHGVAVAAFLHGVPLVHAWAGPGVHARSLFMGASVAKGCTAAALAVLHSRGLLDYTARVSSVWPEFQRNGKGEVTIEQARATASRASDGFSMRVMSDARARLYRTAQGCTPRCLVQGSPLACSTRTTGAAGEPCRTLAFHGLAESRRSGRRAHGLPTTPCPGRGLS